MTKQEYIYLIILYIEREKEYERGKEGGKRRTNIIKHNAESLHELQIMCTKVYNSKI